MYDSLHHDLSSSLEQQIACIMNTPYNELIVDFIDVQHQSGPNDCGLFAIANITMLCIGKQPEYMLYAQQKMRSHLLRCFGDGVLTKFPTIKERRVKTNRIVNTQLINVHCVCRMPNIKGLSMICCSACNTWFHGNICVQVEDAAWKRSIPWYCDNCRT